MAGFHLADGRKRGIPFELSLLQLPGNVDRILSRNFVLLVGLPQQLAPSANARGDRSESCPFACCLLLDMFEQRFEQTDVMIPKIGIGGVYGGVHRR